jgi:putative membrane protein
VRGPLFGLIVWTTSYFGLLPALGILTSAEKHPVRRSGLMIVAHLVWGWVLAMLLETFLSDQKKAAAFHTSPGSEKDQA